jgi:hypothetical protein
MPGRLFYGCQQGLTWVKQPRQQQARAIQGISNFHD